MPRLRIGVGVAVSDRPELPLRPIIASILAPAFPGVKIATKAPSPLPAKWIKVERAGGGDRWAIDSPLVILQFHAPDDVECERMALHARSVMRGAIGQIHASAIVLSWDTVGGPHNFPDIDATPVRDRWQMTGELGIATA